MNRDRWRELRDARTGDALVLTVIAMVCAALPWLARLP